LAYREAVGKKRLFFAHAFGRQPASQLGSGCAAQLCRLLFSGSIEKKKRVGKMKTEKLFITIYIFDI